jgi:hypothetical protein
MHYSFLIVATGVSGVVVGTQYDYGTLARFPIAFRVTHTNRTIPGLGLIDLSESFTALVADDLIPQNISWHHVDEIIIANGLDQIQLDREVYDVASGTEYTFNGLIGASIISEFVTERFGFLTTPVSRDDSQLVISPQNASAYAYGGDLFYAENAHGEYWAVPTAARIVSSTSSQMTADEVLFEPCFLKSFSRHIFLPQDTLEELLSQLRRRGVVVSFNPDFDGTQYISLQEIPDSVVDSLPSIQILIQDQHQRQISIAIINPREYVEDDPDDEWSKQLLFKPRQVNHPYSFVHSRSISLEQTGCSFRRPKPQSRIR